MRKIFVIYNEDGSPFNVHTMDDESPAFAKTVEGVKWATAPRHRCFAQLAPLPDYVAWQNGDPAPLLPETTGA
jgi:hypothetical protein